MVLLFNVEIYWFYLYFFEISLYQLPLTLLCFCANSFYHLLWTSGLPIYSGLKFDWLLFYLLIGLSMMLYQLTWNDEHWDIAPKSMERNDIWLQNPFDRLVLCLLATAWLSKSRAAWLSLSCLAALMTNAYHSSAADLWPPFFSIYEPKLGFYPLLGLGSFVIAYSLLLGGSFGVCNG